MYDIEAKLGFQTDRLEKLYSAAKDKKYTDVQFTVRDRSIFAHMVILAACSEIFIKESVEKLNRIFSGFDDAVIDALLRFCYTGVIKIEEDLYEKFKDLATQLEIYNLYYKTIDVKNSLEALTFSNDPASVETAMYFALENFENLYKTPDFLDLPFSTLTDIIKSDYLCVSSEAHVIRAVKLWVDKDDDKRRPKLKELLSFVKLPGLAMEMNHTEVWTGYYSSPEYTEMVNQAIDSILKHQKNTSQRWKSVKIVLDNINIAIYDSKNKSWTKKMYPFGIFGYVSTLIDDWIMIIGGNKSKEVKYIDLKDGQMHTLKPMHQNRWFSSAVTMRRHSSTDIYVIGGQFHDETDGSLFTTPSVERWKSDSKRWEFVAPLITTISEHRASVVDDKIYVTGGRLQTGSTTKKVQMYSPDTENWSLRASMKHKRQSHSVNIHKYCCVDLKRGIQDRGERRSSIVEAVYSTASIGSPARNAFQFQSAQYLYSLGTIHIHSATINGKLYVAGGVAYIKYSRIVLDTVEEFDPKANLWIVFCKLPSPRSSNMLSSFRNKLLCIGGMDDEYEVLSDVLEYDDKNKTWKTLKKLLSKISGAYSAFVIPYDSVI
ncbi:kelch-like protein 24 [Arctopsyche grandis]|uniref:kelch-like protein 24 n=1 Tax=Arctopsyche grandis TaxID=121162 RepID=UPI00406DA283